MCIFLFTVLIHCTLCRDCSHIFVNFQTFLWGRVSSTSPFLPCFRPFFKAIIRECGSTVYVGLAHTAPPTNTNFQLIFLLTRLQEAFYEDLPVLSIKFKVYHHFSGLRFIPEVNFWHPSKNVISCDYS